MLKLLKKAEIDRAKAEDRQREINEGVKLARRVDALREAQVEEEAVLEKFRKETIFSINKEIVSLSQTKGVLVGEVEFLELRKKEAIEPLDRLWEAVKIKQDEVDSKTEEFKKMNKEYLLQKDTMEVNLVESQKVLSRSKQNEKVTEKLLLDADYLHIQAKEKMLASDKYYEVTFKKLKDFEKELREKEISNLSTERDLNNRRDFLNNREVDLDNRERKINDRYETLLRTLNRKL